MGPMVRPIPKILCFNWIEIQNDYIENEQTYRSWLPGKKVSNYFQKGRTLPNRTVAPE